jgi:hypothetical protein
MENNNNLKLNSIPVYSDIFGIILSELNLRDLINFSMSCRRHHCEVENNNLIWKFQMLKLCPAFEIFCDYINNNKVGYKDIVKEIIYLSKYDKGFGINLAGFLNYNIYIIITCLGNINYHEHKFIYLMLRNYLIKNLKQFDSGALTSHFLKYCYNNDIETVKVLLNYSVECPDGMGINLWECDGMLFYYVFSSSLKNTEIIKLLLGYLKNYLRIINIDTNKKFINDMFIDACKKGSRQENIDKVKILLEFIYRNVKNSNAIDSNEAFICACTSGNVEAVKIILEYSKKYPERNLFHYKLYSNKIKFGEVVFGRSKINKEVLNILI